MLKYYHMTKRSSLILISLSLLFVCTVVFAGNFTPTNGPTAQSRTISDIYHLMTGNNSSMSFNDTALFFDNGSIPYYSHGARVDLPLSGLNTAQDHSVFLWVNASIAQKANTEIMEITDGTRCLGPAMYVGGISSVTGTVEVDKCGDGNIRVPLTTTTVLLNSWHQIGYTYSGNNVITYLDGVSVSSHAITYPAINNPILKLFSDSGGTQTFAGLASEVAVFSRALSPTDISIFYNSGTHIPSNSSGLVGLWRLDEGSGTIALDSSGHHNNGTLINGPTYVASKHFLANTHVVSMLSGPTGVTSNSISEIYADLANLIPAENLRTGASYLGVTGHYGVSDNRAQVPVLSSSLTPGASPNNATGYTLGDLYNLIKSGTTNTSGGHFLTTSDSIVSTMHTTTDVYNALASLMSTMSPDDIKIGHKYLGVTGNYSPVNYGLQFDGVNDYVSLTNPISFNTDATINVWAKQANTTDRFQTILGGGSDYWGYPLLISNNDQVVFVNTTSNENLSWGLTTDTNWHLYTVTQVGHSITLYIDGVSQGAKTAVGYIEPVYKIGKPGVNRESYSGWHWNFSGIIGELSVFSRALSSDEVVTLYNGGAGIRISTVASGNPGNTGLVGLWQFDENTGTTAYDSSGNGNDGILVNGPTYVAIPTYLVPVSFVSPTPADGSSISTSYISVHLSYFGLTSPYYSFVNLDNSLVGWWRGENDASDSAGTYDGAWVGTSSYSNGVFGKAFSFDGTNYIDAGVIPALASPKGLTVSTWVKLDHWNTTNQYHDTGIVATRAPGGLGWQINGDSSGGTQRFSFGGDGGGCEDTTNNYNTGQWYHLVGTMDSLAAKLYVNGTLACSGTVSNVNTSLNSSSNHLWIGNYYDNGNRKLNGSIDDTMIFSRVLSSDEISSLYDSQANAFNTNVNLTTGGANTIQGVVVDQNGVAKTGIRTITTSWKPDNGGGGSGDYGGGSGDY